MQEPGGTDSMDDFFYGDPQRIVFYKMINCLFDVGGVLFL